MAKITSKKELLKAVKQELSEPHGIDDNDEDSEFQSDGTPILFGRRAKTGKEIAIDEMLTGLERGQGWYLKLSKEIGINEWQLKKRIDDFEHVADLELFITELVRKETQAEYQKTKHVYRWGSGRYMITFFRDGGIRGEKRLPVFFNIDAQEPEDIANNNTIDPVMADILRSTIQNPTGTQEQIMGALTKGMEIGAMRDAKAESGNNTMLQLMMSQQQQSTQMMTGLLSAIIPALAGNKAVPEDAVAKMNEMVNMLKNTGVIQPPVPPKPEKTLMEQVAELKALGLIKPDESDPMNMVTRLKQIMDIASQFTGAGPSERPGIVEKLIDVLGPQIGKVVGAVSTAAEVKNQAALREMQMQPSMPAPAPVQGIPEPTQIDAFTGGARVYDVPPPSSNPNIRNENGGAMQLMKYLPELKQAVLSNDTSKFNRITSVLASFLGGEEAVRNSVASGQVNAEMLVNYLTMFDATYKQPQAQGALQEYVNSYIAFLSGAQTIMARCPLCHADFEFDSLQQWEDERGESNGVVKCGRDGCMGELELMR